MHVQKLLCGRQNCILHMLCTLKKEKSWKVEEKLGLLHIVQPYTTSSYNMTGFASCNICCAQEYATVVSFVLNTSNAVWWGFVKWRNITIVCNLNTWLCARSFFSRWCIFHLMPSILDSLSLSENIMNFKLKEGKEKWSTIMIHLVLCLPFPSTETTTPTILDKNSNYLWSWLLYSAVWNMMMLKWVTLT